MSRFGFRQDHPRDHTSGHDTEKAQWRPESPTNPLGSASDRNPPLPKPESRPRGWHQAPQGADPIFFPSQRGGRRTPRAMIIGGAALGILGVLIYLVFQPTSQPEPRPLKIIRAPEGLIKTRPDDPGGMTIPHQDKLVYDAIGSSQRQAVPEKIIASPETLDTPSAEYDDLPLTAKDSEIVPYLDGHEIMTTGEDSPQALKTVGELQDEITTLEGLAPEDRVISSEDLLSPMETPEKIPSETVTNLSEPSESSQATTPPSLRSDLPSKPLSSPKTPASKKAQSGLLSSGRQAQDKTKAPRSNSRVSVPGTSQIASQKNPKSEKPASMIASAVYHVQLASLTSQALAELEQKRLWQLHGDILRPFRTVIRKVDLKQRGVTYTVIASPLPSGSAAHTLCSSLSQRRVGCRIIAPQAYEAP